MTTQLDFKKRKKGTANSDVKTENSQVLLPHPINEKQAYDLMDSQAFCSLCESYHKPSSKLRCALNRAIRKIGEKNPSHEQQRETIRFERKDFGRNRRATRVDLKNLKKKQAISARELLNWRQVNASF